MSSTLCYWGPFIAAAHPPMTAPMRAPCCRTYPLGLASVAVGRTMACMPVPGWRCRVALDWLHHYRKLAPSSIT